MADPVIDRAQIHHIASLAELELTNEEEERLAVEIGRIVAYVAELDAIDTRGVPPTSVVISDAAPLRADEPATGLPHDEALSGAPRAEHGGFSVPTFVE